MIADRLSGQKLSDQLVDKASNGRVDNIKTPFFNQNKKRIALQLPICSPQYSTIITNNGYSYIYPQAFTIDETANEVLIAYNSSGGSNTNQWVSIYDWTTGVHKTTFSAGNGIGEGIRVIYSGGIRFLYLKGEISGNLSRYDITTLPLNLARLTAESTYNVDHYAQFTERNGYFYIESNTQPTGTNNRRNVFTRFSSDLTTRLGEVSFNIFDSGDLNTYETYLTKRQGLAVGNGFFVGGYGALCLSTDLVTTERYMGTKIFNNLGECVATNLYSPDLMMNVLSQNGVTCTRIENEGVCITSDNKIYSFFVTQDATTSTSSSTGIVIFEEFSNLQNAIDFTSAVAPTVSFPKYASVHYPPRTQGAAIYNPVTGAKFNTLNNIMDFMVAVDCREFQFYTTSATGITDIAGVAFPSSCHVLIHNMNNSTFFYEVRNQTKNDYYLVNGSSPRVQTKATFSEVGLSTSSTPAVNSGMTIQLTSDTQLTFKVKGSDGVVRSTNLTLA